MTSSVQRPHLLFAVACAVPCLLGCGSGHNTTTASGKVTFDGSPPPAEGKLYFVAGDTASGETGRSGTATFAKDGSFTATSWDEGDGLQAGKYTVRVECWKTPPTMDEIQGVSYVGITPTPIEIEIPPGGKSDIVIDVPLAK